MLVCSYEIIVFDIRVSRDEGKLGFVERNRMRRSVVNDFRIGKDSRRF